MRRVIFCSDSWSHPGDHQHQPDQIRTIQNWGDPEFNQRTLAEHLIKMHHHLDHGSIVKIVRHAQNIIFIVWTTIGHGEYHIIQCSELPSDCYLLTSSGPLRWSCSFFPSFTCSSQPLHLCSLQSMVQRALHESGSTPRQGLCKQTPQIILWCIAQ